MVKRYAMEFVGTFFLTLAISLIANPIAIGFMLMAMIYVGGHVSGAHFNSAITFICMIQNRLDFHSMIKYIIAQVSGALVALCFFEMVTNNSFTLDIIPSSPIISPMAIEALLTLVFAWVYLTMNLINRYKDTTVPGIILGLTLLAIATTGGLFNPAVACASIICDVVKGSIATSTGSIIVYIAGPTLGAFLASFLFDYFKPEM